MNNDLFLNCPICKKDTNHIWVPPEFDGYGNLLPELWYCDQCNTFGSDTVTEIEDARAKRAFHNFINSAEPKQEYLTALHVMAEQGATPGWIRYLMQYAYQAGFKDAQNATDNDSGVFLGTEL